MGDTITKPEVARLVAQKLRSKGIKRNVRLPASKFTITDEEGNSSVFRVKKTNRSESYTIKDAETIIDAMWEVIEEALTEDKAVNFYGYGTFELRYNEATRLKHPLTKEWIEVKGRHRASFFPGTKIKQTGRSYDMQVEDELEAAELEQKILDGEL